MSMDSDHYDNINCLAYYGITTGKTADTYDPQSSVTRSQMALFLTRAAKVAGIGLGDAMDMGFTDLGMTGADRVAAINVLAAKGIMPGRTATTFDPEGVVSRADMAQHLFTLLDLALDSVVIDQLPDSVEGNNDGVGRIELNATNGVGERPDDYFGDVRRTQPVHIADMINAVYELGITTGTNGMTGDSGTFEPDKPVTRAQMASFIMRTMNHTNLRPAGVTAQQTSDDTQVSVRDASFAPVPLARVEVTQSAYASDAFDSSGRCIDRFVSAFDPSLDDCTIDIGDAETDAEGNAMLKPGSSAATPISCAATGAAPVGVTAGGTYSVETPGSTNPDAASGLWAWTGGFGDSIDESTERFEVVPAHSKTRQSTAVAAVVSGGTSFTVKMGQTLTYTIQLVDRNGKPVGPNPGADHSYTVTTVTATGATANTLTTAEATSVPATPAGVTGGTVVSNIPQTRQPDNSGKITITVRVPDPNPAPIFTPTGGTEQNNAAPVQVAVRVQRGAGNMLPLVDSTKDTGTSYRADADSPVTAVDVSGETFDDDNSIAASLSVSPGTRWRLLSPVGNRNNIVATVLDQYGNPFRGTGLTATATPSTRSALASDEQTVATTVIGGTARISYSNGQVTPAAITETVSVSDGTRSDSGTVYWAALATALTDDDGTDVNLLLADASTRHLVVNSGNADPAVPRAYPFGDDDTFTVDGTPLTLAQFLEVLKVGSDSKDSRIGFNVTTGGTLQQTMLTWSGYNYNRPRDGATWMLTGLTCSKPTYSG